MKWRYVVGDELDAAGDDREIIHAPTPAAAAMAFLSGREDAHLPAAVRVNTEHGLGLTIHVAHLRPAPGGDE